ASNACRPNLEPTLRIGLRSHAYHACALPLSYEGWSRRADLNRCLSFTRARFFPIELLRLERIVGLEPMYADWQPAVLAAGRNPQKLERNVRIELTSGVWKTPALPLDESRLVAGVGIEPTRAGIMRPRSRLACPHHNIQLSKNWSGTSDSNRDSLAPKASGLSHFPSPRK